MSQIRIAFALLLLSATCAPMRAQTQPAKTGYAIAGVVLNAKTGQPVHNADVTLNRTPTRSQGRQPADSTVTDADGHFAFGQPPGRQI